jgi:RNA polymerase sigma factor (sigma-70 family)
MAKQPQGPALRHIETLFKAGTLGGLTDGELLQWYANRGGEAAELAFATLVDRHGPMVLRVGREILHNEHAAHDAFQATFLVLLRRSGSLWIRDSLGPWLYQVAVRVAWNARSAASRRHRHEGKAAAMAPRSLSHEAHEDSGPILHEELSRLPERYRAVVVLCYLEGLTQQQAAQHLGWPIGTVQSRLARGRERLRSRLVRRGLAPTLIVAGISPARTLSATIPPALADSTIKAATWLATTRSAAISGLSSTMVATLTEGVLRTMMFTKLKIAFLGLFAIGLLATGVGILAGQEPASRPDPSQAPGTTAPSEAAGSDRRPATASPDEEPEDLLKSRLVEAARLRLKAQEAYYKEGRITIDRYLDASNQLMHAEIQASKTREERIAAARANLDRVKQVEANERTELQEGRGTSADLAEATQRRLQAELDFRAAASPTGPYEIGELQNRVRAVERKLDLVLKALERLEHSRDR